MRVLALDIGDKRTGAAISDELGISSGRILSIEGSRDKQIYEIISLLREYSITHIVIGLPLELSGEEGPRVDKVKKFINRLEKSLSSKVDLNMPIIDYLDERLTTAQAKRILSDSSLHNKQASAALDRVVANILLEAYLTKTKMIK